MQMSAEMHEMSCFIFSGEKKKTKQEGSLKDNYIPRRRMTVRVVGPLVVWATAWPSG